MLRLYQFDTKVEDKNNYMITESYIFDCKHKYQYEKLKNYIVILLMSFVLSLQSCLDNTSESESFEDLPLITRDQISTNNTISTTEEYIIKVDSIEQISMELVKKSTTLHHTPNGQTICKIHVDNLPIHCSSDDFGNWFFIGVEMGNDCLIKTVEKGSLYQEIWKENNKIASIYYIKDKEGNYIIPTNLWYDDVFLRGYVHKSNIEISTIPERELEKIIQEGNLSKSAFDNFLWKFNFKYGGNVHNGSEDLMMFYMHPAHVDGESAPDRLLLIFENNKLSAVKHDRPLKIQVFKNVSCEKGLTLSVIANWDNAKIESFADE